MQLEIMLEELYGDVYSIKKTITNIQIGNSHITGNTFVGAIGGRAGGKNCYSYNNYVSGQRNVGGMFGEGQYNITSTQLEVNNSQVIGTGNNIGGLVGSCAGTFTNTIVRNSTVEGTSITSEGVGGLYGMTGVYGISRFQVQDTNIINKGILTGGMVGRANGPSITEGYIENVNVEGREKVGGLLGEANAGTTYNVYVNANVKATSHTAGGIIGYIENEEVSAIQGLTYIYQDMVINTKVEAPTKAGGLVGDMTKELYTNKDVIYNNYIEADVISQDDNTGSLLVGGRKDQNPYLKNTYVYRYSTLNGQYVYHTSDNMGQAKYLVRTDLEKESTYKNDIKLPTSVFDYTALTENKYPKLKDTYLYHPELQEGIDLPQDPPEANIAFMNKDENTEEEHIEGQEQNKEQNEQEHAQIKEETELPTIIAYPISVYEMNIDFSQIPENTYFTYSINGQEKDTIKLEKRTYTFTYNYQDTIEIKITKDGQENTMVIHPEDVKRKASMEGTIYAYLNGETLFIGEETQEGEYVNLYKGEALRKTGEVYSIKEKQLKEIEKVETTLEQETKPMETYAYKGNEIKVYGKYSTINGKEKEQIYRIKNGILTALSNKLDMKIGEQLIDSYNEKEYQTILGQDGKLYDIKENIKYPDNFVNNKIEEIETSKEEPIMMMYYQNGKVEVFNYVTGEILYEKEQTEKISLFDYIKEKFTKPQLLYAEAKAEYVKSQELVEKLKETPIEIALQTIPEQTQDGTNTANTGDIGNIENIGNTSTSNGSPSSGTGNSQNQTNIHYITVYNPETQDYDIYNENEIIEGEEKIPETENAKIQANGLQEFYNTNMTKAKSTQSVNGLVIAVIMLMAIVIALILLRKNIMPKKKRMHKAKK